jgi:hypothetical protein
MTGVVEVSHNLDPRRFVWLWMKYVTGVNDTQHCTNVLRGRYSKKLSKHRAGVGEQGLETSIVCDEQPAGSFSALYVCGVAQQGYRQKQNYPHNLHLPILPSPGEISEFAFEEWRFTIRNGVVLPIPSEAELPERYRSLPPECTTCRIFRWAVTCPSLGVTAFGSS